MRRKILIVGFLLLLFSGLQSQILIALKDQIPVMLKSLNYESSLKTKINNHKIVNIGILFDQNDKLSVKMKDEVSKIFKKNRKIKVYGNKIEVIPIAYENPAKLEKEIIIKGIHVVFYCIGLDEHLEEIKNVVRSNTMISLSPRIDDIKNGMAVLGVIIGESGYKPFINFKIAKNNMLNFSTSFLKLAEVVK